MLTEAMKSSGSWRGGVMARLRLRRCDHVGQGVRVRGVPRIINAGHITVGDSSRIDSLPVISHLATGARGRLEIGARVTIGAGTAIAAHVCVRVLDGASLGPGVMILDTDFHAAGEKEGPGRSAPIVVGRDVRLGARVTVLRGACIGDNAVVAPGSVVSGEIAAGSRVAGVPARLELEPAIGASDEGDVVRRVCTIVGDVLRLDAPPAPDRQTRDISAWDSLGVLNVLLSLEGEFRMTLRPVDVATVQSIAGLAALVERALETAEDQLTEV